LGVYPYFFNKNLKKKVDNLEPPVNTNLPYCTTCNKFVNPHTMIHIGHYAGNLKAYGCPSCSSEMLDENHISFAKNHWIRNHPKEYYEENIKDSKFVVLILGFLILISSIIWYILTL